MIIEIRILLSHSFMIFFLAMKNAAAICFAKTPGVTPAKTRLAKDIGAEKCLQLYLLLLNRCKELMSQIHPIIPYVAVNESQSSTHPIWKDQHVYIQEGLGLGEKLFNAQKYFFYNHRYIIFWGTDSPSLTKYHFVSMLLHLSEYQVAIIPARDGGFVAYAATEQLKKSSWSTPRYSTEKALDDLINQIDHLSCTKLDPLSDLDTIDDIPVVIEEMNQYPSQGKSWDELKKFLTQL